MTKMKSRIVKTNGRELPAGRGLLKDATTEVASREAKPLPAKMPKSAIGHLVTKPKATNAKAATPSARGDKPTIVATTDGAAAPKPKTTKQEQVLTMLSQKGGVTIDEVMKATGWQKHSVRGFFAGTVRKKLGFELTSEKGEGIDRRYAIKVAA
jgi:hypothetical protein